MPPVCTATCTDPQWSVMPSLLPDLSIADSLKITAAILTVWGLAVAARMLRRYIAKRL
jgi:hypothetical protein